MRGGVNVGACTGLTPAQWYFPQNGANIFLAANHSLCLDFVCDMQPCVGGPDADGIVWWGPDAEIVPCAAATSKFRYFDNGSIGVIKLAGLCLSQGNCWRPMKVQATPCGHDPRNEKWYFNGSSGNANLVVADGVSDGFCAFACAEPPADPNSFCPIYHPIHGANTYDPSGPFLDKNGLWHLFEDDGGWSHWISRDLVHWDLVQNTTGFSTLTGSLSPTPSGVFAFWPFASSGDHSCCSMIESAEATDASLTHWKHRGQTISRPKRINAGFRDPFRAFQYQGKWYVGVGCGSDAIGAQVCLFEADDETLSRFTDRGSLYTTNVTFGEIDNQDIVWKPNNVSANMMECPDFFPLADDNDNGTWVLLGSLYKTNQWWVGTVAGSPPCFTPTSMGILDYGQGYAAKTGTAWVQGSGARRVMFSFTGWQAPTSAPGCGRIMNLPREISVRGGVLTIEPVNETAKLRVPGSGNWGSEATELAAGSQVEVRMKCSGLLAAEGGGNTGKVGVRTLGTADGTTYTEVGYDLGEQALYVDHTHCCAAASSIVQRAPVRTSDIGDVLELVVFIDGALIESFVAGRAAITALVSPDERAARPAERNSSTFSDISGLSCSVGSWQLAYK